MPPFSSLDEWRLYSLRVAAAFGLPAWESEEKFKDGSLFFDFGKGTNLRFFLVVGDWITVLQVDNAPSNVLVQWRSNAPQKLSYARCLSDNAAQEVALRLLRAVFCLGYLIESLCAQAGVSVSGHDKIEWALAMKEAGYPMST